MVENKNTVNFDSDLDDLLEVEDLLKEVRSEDSRRNSNGRPSLLSLCCLYVSYSCEYFPRLCMGLACFFLVIPSYLLIMQLLNPTEQYGVIKTDYTVIQSKYDLKVGSIDHWCLGGGNDFCKCEDPLQPQARAEFRKWTNTHIANKEMVNSWVEHDKDPDIAFFGASVVEEMDGRWFGSANDTDLRGLGTLFDNNFNKEKGGSLDGVALGIAGDTNPSILWRLVNGEMPASFNPKIWWLELGMNDLGRTQCSEEVVILGILRVVEEIVNKKPDAKIVINSILPMAQMRSFGVMKPHKLDYKDSFFRDTKKKIPRNNDRQRKLSEIIDINAEFETHPPQRRMRIFGRFFGGSKDEDAPMKKPPKPVKMSAAQMKQKKYNVLHRKRKVPLWTSINAINSILKKFCAKHDGVYFFDATEYFADREDGKYWTLRTEAISMKGHPTKAGYKAWEAGVVSTVTQLLSEGN